MFSILGCKVYSAENGKVGINIYKQHKVFDEVEVIYMTAKEMREKNIPQILYQVQRRSNGEFVYPLK